MGDSSPGSREAWPAGRSAWPFAAVLAAGLFAWWGSWNHDHVFDDNPAIRDNAALLAGDWWDAAFGTVHQPLANRPFSCLTLALDFAVFGAGPFGPHVTNLLLHLANGVMVLLVVRGLLQAPNLAVPFDRAGATRIATAIASLWVVHPLATDAVAYATQRSTLLFSGALLACLLATLRAHGSARPTAWRTVAVLTMALGMASKEDLVAGPLLVVLFERAFLLPSWRALRTRAGFYTALASTWFVLAGCVAAGPSNPTVGFATPLGTTWYQWLYTQAGVVAHYVKLALWPQPLRGAYDWAVVERVSQAALPGLFVLLLLGATIAAWRRHAPWGWLGTLFFLLLAPTSSVMPIVTEVIAERRAYLPMLSVLVPVVFVVRGACSRLCKAAAWAGASAAIAAIVGFALLARHHATVYASESSFWKHAFDWRETGRRSHLAAQILSNHGAMLFAQGRFDEAGQLFDEAMQCVAPSPMVRTHYAASLQRRGRHAEAVAHLETAIAASPRSADTHGTLGTCLLLEQAKNPGGADDARLLRAIAALQEAVRLLPTRDAFWNSLGYAFGRRGKWQEAERAYARACELSGDRNQPFFNRAEALEHLGQTAAAEAMFRSRLLARPRDVQLRLELVKRACEASRWNTAIDLLTEVQRIDPTQTQVAEALRELRHKVR